MFVAVLATVTGFLTAPALAADRGDGGRDKAVRFATYNASLNRAAAGQLVSDLSTPDNGLRNHDEIRFWADYVRPGAAATSTTMRAAAAGCVPGPVS